jgi:PleD family two-component response regulator
VAKRQGSAGEYPRRRVESARIAERLSITDALTSLKNRRYVPQTIGAEIAATKPATRSCSRSRRPDRNPAGPR